MKTIIEKIFTWIFKSQLTKLEAQIRLSEKQTTSVNNMLGNIDVSVDVHQRSPSWAVISIQGKKTDYIKFIDLGEREIRDIQMFLRNFDRTKVDANPQASKFLRISKF